VLFLFQKKKQNAYNFAPQRTSLMNISAKPIQGGFETCPKEVALNKMNKYTRMLSAGFILYHWEIKIFHMTSSPIRFNSKKHPKPASKYFHKGKVKHT
jgi:hypothetical protein